MNYLKNTYKIIFKVRNIILLIIPLIIITLLSCKKELEMVSVISENNDHFIVTNQEEDNLSIPLYIEEKYSFYYTTKNIDTVKITDDIKKEKYEIKLKKIEGTKTILKRNNKEYKKYNFICEFNYITCDELRLPSCNLVIKYINGEIHQNKIGSLYSKKIENREDIRLHSMKGLVNNIIPSNNEKLLSTVGIVLTISSEKKITINNIETIHGNARTNQDQIIKLNDNNINNNVEISSLVNDYRINYTKNVLEQEIELNDETKTLLIPLSYTTLEVIDKVGLIITYKYNDTLYEQYIDVMPIFNSTNNQKYYEFNYDPNN